MTALIRHRGPDDGGTWIDEEAGIGLGFRRLAILDLSPAGHQPMASPSGRFICVFNGEVFNHGDLRIELEGLGYSFRGHSDTEVIVAAVEQWGIEASVGKFVGMFAIALWDRRHRVLHLVRDRMGIKPLYVYAEPGRILFASELKSLSYIPDLDRSLNDSALLAYLRRLHIPGPTSIFQRVSKLLPGHILSIRSPSDPLPDPKPYWCLEDVATRGISAPRMDETEALETLDGLLRTAVKQRMIADVPLGAFLSGGIDSSLIVALMQEVSDRPVQTFAIGFDDSAHNETPYAADIARHLGTLHFESILTADDARELVPELSTSFDEPFASSSAIPNLLVCAKAKSRVTVALSGVGGDEIFGGYNRYTQLERAVQTLRLPRSGRRFASGALAGIGSRRMASLQETAERLLPGFPRIRLPEEKVRKLTNLLRRDDASGIYRSLISAWQDPAHLLPNAKMPYLRDDLILDSDGRLPSVFDRAMLSDQIGYLADDQLVVADRASMAASLEVRVPFLDHRVVEHSWRLPRSLKIEGGVGKRCLRTLLSRRVPQHLYERPKTGFSVPLDSWLRGPLRDWAGDLLSHDRIQRQGVFSPSVVAKEWQGFLRHEGSSALELWTLVMFQSWMDRWSVS